jgi:hypothetical protein
LPSRSSLPARDGETEAPDDLGAFGWLRGVRDRALMLELRRKDDSVMAFAYAWLPGWSKPTSIRRTALH